MGLLWLSEALRPHIPAARDVVTEPALALAGAAALLLAMIVGLFGSMLAQRPHPRGAAACLLAAGLLPGLLDPRAFVVTSLTCLAGLLAASLEPRRRRREPPTPPELMFSTEELSLG
jgi:hypothetical protein